MNEDRRRAKEHARSEAERHRQEAERLTKDPELQQEWVRQDGLIFGGLIGVGVVMVQPFLTAGSLDRLATICVVAWSVAIPLLAALLVVNRHETFRGHQTDSRIVAAARPLAMMLSFAGLVAGFWHIHWIAGVGTAAAALVAVGVHSAGFSRLEFANKTPPEDVNQNSEAPGSEKEEDPGPSPP